ncbi:MAG TPA: hypothetical protein VGP13_03475 [Candidatus Paceibacterota bacterium]|nr:hypothetical protein [Candidatus Paceibacterota bacterium]
MDGGFNFFNLEYFLLRVYDLFGSFHPGTLLGSLPSWVHFVITEIAIWGTVITLLFVLLIVYTQIRLTMVEHEGFHGKEEHQVHEVEAAAPPPQSERWRRIMELASSGSQSDWRRAILEADVMLSATLAQAGYEGSSVGEQLKLTNPLQVTTLRLAWDAHMVRNQVAHGGEMFELSERDTRVAIDQYRRVFEEFGVI